MLKSTGYAGFDAKSPLKFYEFNRREMGDFDVHIEIKYCGVCHSDIHTVRNEWGGAQYPLVPGHEIVGVVKKVGAKVKHHQEGELVGVGCMVNSCGDCTCCHDHLEQFCYQGATFTYNSIDTDGNTTKGGYSDNILVHEKFVLKIPTNLKQEAVAPLLCAGITTYSPLKHWNIGKNDKVGIIGLGGLGHMAVKFARSFGAHVVVFTTSPQKKDVRLCSISGGTDLISCFALGNPLLPIYSGELQSLGLGMDVAIFDDHGQKIIDTPGELVCLTPFPSMPIGFWQDIDKSRYFNAYFNKFPNVWTHGDRAKITTHQGLIIYGRSDATLNPGGIRIGTAEIYRPLEAFPDIEDSVVIAQEWRDDTRIILFVKLRPPAILTEALKTQIKDRLKQEASPRHVPAKIIQVSDIPKTLNGKTVELAVRDTIHGKPVDNLNSLANPEALEIFKNQPELNCE